MPSGADTCSAGAYYQFGVAQLEEQPARAADAFYWAQRLDPTWPDAPYARRIALLASDPFTLGRYYDGDERLIRSAKIAKIDSLQLRAFQLNPFLYERLEQRMFLMYLRFLLERDMHSEGNSAPLPMREVELLMARYLIDAPPETRAWAAYTRGDFTTAAGHYAEAARKKRNQERSWFHAERARVFFLMGQMENARGALADALAAARARDAKKLVYVYESKALYEHAIGLTYEMQGNPAAAREAYGRALQEDMSYYPAHVRTGVVALAAGDTAAAIAAMELAAQVRPDEPTVLYQYGELLLAARRPADAEAPLRRLIATEPYFAQTYYLLGRALQAQGKRADAAVQYRAFLDRAARGDGNRAGAEAALRDLLTVGAS